MANTPQTQTASPAPTSTDTEQRPLNGARVFHDALVKAGVEVIFGYTGGAILPFTDSLYGSPIRFILPRHEQGGTHMADGYARASGKVGVVMATSGPGATNLVTGLGTANMDSVPIVAITGQVRSYLIGNDAFQEADVIGVSRPVTKYNTLIKDPSSLARVVREAFHIASTGRPGTVLIDLPVDMTTVEMSEPPSDEMKLPGYRPRYKGHLRQIKLAAEAINNAERPVLYVGGGVILANAAEELRTVALKGNIPTTTTLLGLGAFDESHELALHMLGMHGAPTANYAVQDADVLVSVGARFDDRVTGKVDTFAPKAKIIHIDVDPSSISKSVPVDIPVVGDAKAILEELVNYIEHRPREQWLNKIKQWKNRHPLKYDATDDIIKPQYVIEKLGEVTNHDAVVTTGVGQHQMWAAQFYGFRWPRQMITSGGLGTMGYGFPAAIGAQVARPDKLVVDIDGDASFSMTCQELATAVQYNLPVKVICLNNSFQGMVRQWQELFYGKRYMAVQMVNPDFAKVAEAFGATGISVAQKSDVVPALERAIATDGPVVVDIATDATENVWPMVPAGKGLNDMVLGTLA